jgi:hypothetical protein
MECASGRRDAAAIEQFAGKSGMGFFNSEPIVVHDVLGKRYKYVV